MLVNVPSLDALLDRHADPLGAAFNAYRNHAYRVLNFHCLLSTGDVDLEKLSIAVAYHDLGIWSAGTFDYLAPSIAMANAHLHDIGRMEWSEEIAAMIDHHHKMTPCDRRERASVETFRRADWIDVSKGRVRFGLKRCVVSSVMNMFPALGFHRLLLKLSLKRMLTHPLNPLPMLRW
ncbi:hypothetical protein [Lysobacter auxotrophicus]|uniref:HD domain-containing protein n=1 Tax=Lysobacter auxotrophicus TaxID=2992573 RepID=A0ABM8DDE2_9GAMM|nr:hypothetical protein [Lysobacter auxotrophicus]BDU16604.1 HD domain-containing protein [Lysobacter auxotrophicus]